MLNWHFRLGVTILIFSIFFSFFYVYYYEYYISCGGSVTDVAILIIPNVSIILIHKFLPNWCKRGYWIFILVGISWNLLHVATRYYVVC